MRELTPKQKIFVSEYLLDLNGTQAAIRAGYSKRTANEQAARLLADVSVRSHIKTLIDARAERTQIDADWMLKRLAQDATADVADLYDENGNLRQVSDWPMVWRTGLVAGIETVQERIGTDPDGKPEFATVRKVRLADRTFYTPDFAVMLASGQMELHEVKGFWQDDARAKIKIAAELYPFRFLAAKPKSKKDGGGWEIEVFE